MSKPESQTLADAFESARRLTKFYFSKVKPNDIDVSLTINNIKFNSPYWLAAHLTWTENFLLLNGVLGKPRNIEWLDQYGFGSNPAEIKIKPPYDEIMKTLDSIHDEAMNEIRKLSDEQLKEKNNIGANFGGEDSKRAVLIHAIRHEPMHTGQLSWILKTRGEKLI